MSNRSTSIGDDEAGLAGLISPSFGPPLGQTAKLIPFPAPLPPPWAGEDEDAGCWESIGVLAVRMVADFKRPRILVWSAPEGPREEDPNPPEL